MKKKSIWILGMSFLSLAAVQSIAQAKEVCDTVEECQALKGQVEARLAALTQNTLPNLTEIVKDSKGQVRRMNQLDAEKLCRDQGMRLPTARELALVAQSLGAKGISETPKEDYDLIKGSDSSGRADHFYFSSVGYQRPAGELGDNFFWSSSVHPGYSDAAYNLYGYNGTIDYCRRSNCIFSVAVRCVARSR